MRTVVLIFCLFLMVTPLYATTYYMRGDGTAANKAAATSCSAASTAMNVAKHNSQTFSPGDIITLCDTGGSFTDAVLIVPSSGSAGNPISYTNSGSPVIEGGNVQTGWTSESEGAFTAYYVTEGTQSYVVTSDNVFLWRNSTSKASLTPGQFFWENSDTRLYVRLPTDDAPSGHTLMVGARTYNVQVNGMTYITVQNLTLQRANSPEVIAYNNADHFQLLNNTIRWGGDQSWNANVILDGSSNSLIQGNNCSYGYTCIYLTGFGPATTNNNTVQGNTVSYTARVGISFADGGGIQPTGTIIQYNTVSYCNQTIDDDACIYTFVGNSAQDGNIVRYNLIFNGGSATLRSAGIMIDTGSGLVQVYGNVIYGFSNGCIAIGAPNQQVINNTCYNNVKITMYGAGEIFGFAGDGTSNFYNNIICPSPGMNAVSVDSISIGNTFDYNLYCSGGAASPFYSNSGAGTHYTFSGWKTATGEDTHSNFGSSPTSVFTNPSGNVFTLPSGSPAIGAGFAPWDIGAYLSINWPFGNAVSGGAMSGGTFH
jgi:hypothetical protein